MREPTKSQQRSGSPQGKQNRPRRRSGKPWTGVDLMRLEAFADHQMPAEKIARRLGRSERAVRAEAAKRRVMLAPPDATPTPTGKQPYGGLKVQSQAVSHPVAARPPATSAGPRREANRRRPQQEETLF